MNTLILLAALLGNTIPHYVPPGHHSDVPAHQHNHVDRIEGDWAVVLDGERQVDIPLHWLPSGIHEGDILCSAFIVRLF